jgi:hypothetical protein
MPLARMTTSVTGSEKGLIVMQHNGTPGAPVAGSTVSPSEPWRVVAQHGRNVHLHASPGQLPDVLEGFRLIRPVEKVFGPLPCHLHGGCRRMYLVVLGLVPQTSTPEPGRPLPSAFAGSVRT